VKKESRSADRYEGEIKGKDLFCAGEGMRLLSVSKTVLRLSNFKQKTGGRIGRLFINCNKVSDHLKRRVNGKKRDKHQKGGQEGRHQARGS